MLIWVNKKGEIEMTNVSISDEKAAEYVSENCIWTEAEFPTDLDGGRIGDNMTFIYDRISDSIHISSGDMKISQLDRIEAAVQVSQEMQAFYDAVMEEVEA